MDTVGVLHPGEMGAALALGLRATGVDVLWAGEGRSPSTADRAGAIGLRDVGTLSSLATSSSVVVSVCPPDAALAVAQAVAAVGFAGVYVDANAVAPATAERVDHVVTAAGATYVDGAVIGGPDAPRLFLAGDGAAEVVPLFGPPVTAVVLEGPPYAASALKMLYAGWSKGTTALLLALAAAARDLGVEDALRDEWARSQPAVLARLDASAGSARKAWRWTGEMEEIAATLGAAGQPSGFHEGAAEVYARLASLKDDAGATLDAVLALLLTSPGEDRG